MLLISCEKESIATSDQDLDSLSKTEGTIFIDLENSIIESDNIELVEDYFNGITTYSTQLRTDDSPSICSNVESNNYLSIQSCLPGPTQPYLSYNQLCIIISNNFLGSPHKMLSRLFSHDTDVNVRRQIINTLLPHLPILQDEEGTMYGCVWITTKTNAPSLADGTQFPCPDQAFDYSGDVGFILASPTYTGQVSTFVNSFKFIDECNDDQTIALNSFPFFFGNPTIDNVIYNGLIHNGFSTINANNILVSIKMGNYSSNQVYDLFVNYILEYILNVQGYNDTYIANCMKLTKIAFTTVGFDGRLLRYSIQNIVPDPVYTDPCI